MPVNSDKKALLGQDLSEREVQVLELLALGESDMHGGDKLTPPVSDNTFKTHVRHVFAKLGVDDRAHAVYEGYRRGWLLRPHGAPAAPAELINNEDGPVLHLIAMGLSNHEIARTLHIPLGVVNHRIKRLYKTLGVTKRAMAVRVACLEGHLALPFVTPHEPGRAFKGYRRRARPTGQNTKTVSR